MQVLPTIASWITHIRSAPEYVRSQWFHSLKNAIELAREKKSLIHAGWFQTPEGMTLYRIPEKEHSTAEASPPIYTVDILSLSPIEKFNTTYQVELSQTVMHTPHALKLLPDIASEKIELSITNRQIKEESTHLTFEHTQPRPSNHTYTLLDEKGKDVSFFSFSVMKSIVDESLAKDGYLSPSPSFLSHILAMKS